MRLQRGVEGDKLILPSRSGGRFAGERVVCAGYYAVVTTCGIALHVRVILSEGVLSITEHSMIDVFGDGVVTSSLAWSYTK